MKFYILNQAINKDTTQAKFIALLRRHQPEAMEIMYEQFAPVLFGVALRIVKNEKIAGEVLVQTFNHVWNNHSGYDESRQTLCMWMIGIVRAMAQEKMSFESFVQNQNLSADVNRTGDDKLMESISNLNITKTGISLTTIEQKKVLDLVFFGGGKLNEVAKHLSIDERKAKQLLREAICRYRKESQQV
jgi:RNA polymerase sigma-70 factor, ECF subfamily